jgi:hypothetical protein
MLCERTIHIIIVNSDFHKMLGSRTYCVGEIPAFHFSVVVSAGLLTTVDALLLSC